ncbi:MAG TPA: cytochrome bd-I oxidase subunit CydX [Cycloclasticus sp.]|jgi:cyd operon protein YbgT|nr:cytochrome bd-I oxidase subunit CydX [Cycloclasticus sp.]HIL92941.1 cytochrome bd-I oxidase subunit CydX [Cycloclasticus sp.]
MWYFAWILGVLLACSFGIINAMWLEYNDLLDAEDDGPDSQQDDAIN